MNLCKSSSFLFFCLCYLLPNSIIANEADSLAPSSDTTMSNNSSSSLPSTSPSIVNNFTAEPIATEMPPSIGLNKPTSAPPTGNCTDDPDWVYVHEYLQGWSKENGWSRQTDFRRCDDDRVDCCHIGNLGYARDFCCKCKPADYECTKEPGADGAFPLALQILTCVSFVFMTLLLFKILQERELHNTRQTMTARRQQQRENNERGLGEEEMKKERDELFLSRFYFQEVFPDKSNISVDGFKRSSMKLNGEDFENDEEAKTDIVDGDDAELTTTDCKHSSLSRLSDWWKTSAKDECCICLECYTVGETICAPKTTECSHVFHEECIHEWIKRGNDKCPLCRVELLKE